MQRHVQHKRVTSEAWQHAAALAAVLIVAALAGACSKRDDTVTQAAKADVAQGVPAPTLEQTKAIAEQAYIYGFPMIAAYKAMHGASRSKSSTEPCLSGCLPNRHTRG